MCLWSALLLAKRFNGFNDLQPLSREGFWNSGIPKFRLEQVLILWPYTSGRSHVGNCVGLVVTVPGCEARILGLFTRLFFFDPSLRFVEWRRDANSVRLAVLYGALHDVHDRVIVRRVSVSSFPRFAEVSTAGGFHGKTYRIPVSTGIFEHCSKIKDALWLFLWYIDKTTTSGTEGKVLGGSPITDEEPASIPIWSQASFRIFLLFSFVEKFAEAAASTWTVSGQLLRFNTTKSSTKVF